MPSMGIGCGAASAESRGGRNSNTTGSLHMSTSDTTAAPYARPTPPFSLLTTNGSTTIARCLVALLLAGGAFAASAERSDAQELGKHLGRPDIGAGLLVYTISDTVETFPLLHGS